MPATLPRPLFCPSKTGLAPVDVFVQALLGFCFVPLRLNVLNPWNLLPGSSAGRKSDGGNRGRVVSCKYNRNLDSYPVLFQPRT